MEKEIENLIEELTKVRPEMLNEEALKLFNTIMAILDERDKLRARNKELEENIHKEHTLGYSQGVYDCSEAWKETIEEKIEEQLKEAEDVLENENYLDNFNGNRSEQKYYYEGYKDATIFISELMEDK